MRQNEHMKTTFIICGRPGSGKSTYAQQLAAARKAVLLDIDGSTERLVRLALSESGHSADDRDSDYFKRTFREPIYETLFDIARQNLPWNDVVIVGPFTREIRDPGWPEKLVDRLGSAVEIHFVYCAPSARKERLIKRGNPRDAAKLRDWENHQGYYGEESPPVFPHTFVDMTGPL